MTTTAPLQSTRPVRDGVNLIAGANDDGWQTPPPVTLDDGSVIQLYKDGEALHAAYEAAKAAKHRICQEVYIFASDKTGCAFADLFCEKARQGVRVLVIYDSFGSLASDRAMFQRMADAGVRLRQFNPIRPWECTHSWRPANRDHRKLLIIDEEQAGVGGLNIGKEYAGSWVIHERDASDADCWRDNAISVRGPAARHFQRAFAHTWNYATRGGPIRRAGYDHNLDCLLHPSEAQELAVLASVPSLDSKLRPVLHNLFKQAKSSIHMTMAYFAPDDDLIDTLCNAAKRGVRVRLMLPGKCDIKLLIIAARSFYEKLLSAGVEIYERQAVVLHAKTMTIDERITVIGSTNLDYRSIEFNLEMSAIVRSEEFGKQMAALFENDVQYAEQIKLEAWRRRPVWDRFVQWAVIRARYLL